MCCQNLNYTNENKTVRSLWKDGVGYLRSNNQIQNPEQDAKRLLCHALNQNEVWLHVHAHDRVPLDIQKQYLSDLQRRNLFEPLQYILKEWEFYG